MTFFFTLSRWENWPCQENKAEKFWLALYCLLLRSHNSCRLEPRLNLIYFIFGLWLARLVSDVICALCKNIRYGFFFLISFPFGIFHSSCLFSLCEFAPDNLNKGNEKHYQFQLNKISEKLSRREDIKTMRIWATHITRNIIWQYMFDEKWRKNMVI